MQENSLKQKAQVNWFEEGDKNSKYFHSIIRERRRKLHIHNIIIKTCGSKGMMVYPMLPYTILNTSLITPTVLQIPESLIPSIINEEDNAYLTAMPNMEEIKTVVFSMSSTGPDGYNGTFYHKCWNMIAMTLRILFKAFSMAKNLPNFSLVLA